MRRPALRALGLPHAALSSTLVALMLASLPMGAYVMFSSADVGDELDGVEFTLGGLRVSLPVGPTVGYALAALWCVYAAMLGIALVGPRVGFAGAVMRIAAGQGNGAWLHTSAMAAVASWFAVLILVSAAINAVQSSQGIEIEPPEYGNDLLRLYDATRAPIAEEVGFRMLLIGVPLAVICMRHMPVTRALRSLLHPYASLDGHGSRIAVALVIAVAVLFGVLHVVGDGTWSPGKATQATAAGVILGWVYYRHGLLVAILVHWAANYFVLAFLYFVSGSAGDVAAASLHPAAVALEVLLVVSGAVALVMISLGRGRLL